MGLSAIPSELLRHVAEHLPSDADLSALSKVNSYFRRELTVYLYHRQTTALKWAVERASVETFERAMACGVNIHQFDLLCDAAKGGLAAIVKVIATDKSLLEKETADIRTPLVLASYNGHLEVVQVLIDAGADVGYSSVGFTAMHAAVERSHLEVAQFLLEKGADITVQTIMDGYTPLHSSVVRGKEAAARFLLANGADIEARDMNGYTPLFLAVRPLLRGNVRGRRALLGVVRLLLDHKADPNARTPFLGMTPLLQALTSCQLVDMLLEHGADPNTRFGPQIKGWSALHNLKQQTSIQTLLNGGADIEAKDDEGYTPLHLSAIKAREKDDSRDNLKEMEFLLLVRASSEAVTPHGWNALHLAAAKGDAVYKQSRVNQIMALCTEVARQATTPEGWTALHIAAYSGQPEMASFLAKDPACVNMTDYAGRTPLFYAAKNGQDDIIDMLLEAGADTSLKDHFGTSPLFAAMRNGHADSVSRLAPKNATTADMEVRDSWGIRLSDWGYFSANRRLLVWLEVHYGEEKRKENGGKFVYSDDESEEESEDSNAQATGEDQHSILGPSGQDLQESAAPDNNSGQEADDSSDEESFEWSDGDLFEYSKHVYFVYCDTCVRSIRPGNTAFLCKECPHSGWIICHDCATSSRACLNSHQIQTMTRIRITCEQLARTRAPTEIIGYTYYLSRGMRYPVEWFHWTWHSFFEED